jgi:hypothetical protein
VADVKVGPTLGDMTELEGLEALQFVDYNEDAEIETLALIYG